MYYCWGKQSLRGWLFQDQKAAATRKSWVFTVHRSNCCACMRERVRAGVGPEHRDPRAAWSPHRLPWKGTLESSGKHYGSVVDIMIQELDLGAWKQEEHLGPRPREGWYGGGHSELERDSQTLWSQESSHSLNNYWECQRSFVYVSCIFNTIVPMLDIKTEIKNSYFQFI